MSEHYLIHMANEKKISMPASKKVIRIPVLRIKKVAFNPKVERRKRMRRRGKQDGEEEEIVVEENSIFLYCVVIKCFYCVKIHYVKLYFNVDKKCNKITTKYIKYLV